MRIEKILFPTDFSRPSYEALDVAAALARDRKGTLIIAHCKPSLIRPSGDATTIPSDIDADFDAMLGEALGGLDGVTCVKRFLSGDPAQKIVELAVDEKADLIVLGTHGRTGLTRVVMGSVAEGVVRNAPCPVLTIRQNTSLPTDSPAPPTE